MKLIVRYHDGHTEEWCDTDELPAYRQDENGEWSSDDKAAQFGLDFDLWSIFNNLLGRTNDTRKN